MRQSIFWILLECTISFRKILNQKNHFTMKKCGIVMYLPKISIIIPIYNVEDYLKKCLNSVQVQTLRNYEVILVDDGSTDNSRKICEKFVNEDKRFKLITTDNGGQARARNIGLSYSVGQFISFIDADDCVSPFFLERLYNAMTINTQIVCCKFIDLKKFKKYQFSQKKETYNIDLDTFISKMYTGDIGNVVWNKLFRRSLIESNPFPNGQVHEEVSFFNKIFDKLRYIKVVDETLYGYRKVRCGNTNSTFSSNRAKVFPQLLWMLQFLKKKKLHNALKEVTFYTLVFIKNYYKKTRVVEKNNQMALKMAAKYYKIIFEKFYLLKYVKFHPKLFIKLFLFDLYLLIGEK